MLDSKLLELNTPPFNFCEFKSLFANVHSFAKRVKIQFRFHQQLKAMDKKLLDLETDKSKYGTLTRYVMAPTAQETDFVEVKSICSFSTLLRHFASALLSLTVYKGLKRLLLRSEIYKGVPSEKFQDRILEITEGVNNHLALHYRSDRAKSIASLLPLTLLLSELLSGPQLCDCARTAPEHTSAIDLATGFRRGNRALDDAVVESSITSLRSDPMDFGRLS
nr:disease resistance protein RPM1-like [Ipomoea batatas]